MNTSACTQNSAVGEVISAIGMLGERMGSTAGDILFILEKYHGRVQRHVILSALKAAVTKGLLHCKSGRYKIPRSRQFPIQKLQIRARATPLADPSCSSNLLNRKFKCKIKNVSLRKRCMLPTSSYRPREIMGLRTCKCGLNTSVDSRVTELLSCRSSVRVPRRKQARRNPKRSYRYMSRRTDRVEKQVVPETSISRALPNSSVGVDQSDRDGAKSWTEADEEIKAVMVKMIDLNVSGEDETARNVQHAMSFKEPDMCEVPQSTSSAYIQNSLVAIDQPEKDGAMSWTSADEDIKANLRERMDIDVAGEDGAKSWTQADENIKATIRNMMELDTALEDATVRNILKAICFKESDKCEESTPIFTEQTENLKTSVKGLVGDSSSGQTVDITQHSDNAKDVDGMEVQCKDLLERPSCSHFNWANEAAASAKAGGDDNSVKRTAITEQYRHRTRARATAEKVNLSSSTSSKCHKLDTTKQ